MNKRLYLTHNEIQKIFQALAGTRHCIRDRCMILMCFIHGLRVSELTGLKITDIDLVSHIIYIRRLKNGLSTTHPLLAREISLLNKWLLQRNKYNEQNNDWLFISSKGHRVTRQQFYKILVLSGRLAGLTIQAHPHMLRHACGFELAEQGLDTRLIQDYLGHKNIRHTVHYTASNAARFFHAWHLDSTKKEKERIKMEFSSW
ncbi:type 1 fimbriae regulatory protein FimB [Enterobacter kobei]|nr:MULTISPECIES: tyrosine-type DNA invertase [Enterobacter]EKS6337588.1 tyrosine-type recombinase/integrase [Enterobacter hormaechei]VAL43438.1 type 1 fimbriae regulatory protein FimB [Enterobacter kobei]